MNVAIPPRRCKTGRYFVRAIGRSGKLKCTRLERYATHAEAVAAAKWWRGFKDVTRAVVIARV